MKVGIIADTHIDTANPHTDIIISMLDDGKITQHGIRVGYPTTLVQMAEALRHLADDLMNINNNRKEHMNNAGGTGKGSTPNGYDQRWIDAINVVLDDRGREYPPITDINDALWDKFLGPMVDAIEDGFLKE